MVSLASVDAKVAGEVAAGGEAAVAGGAYVLFLWDGEEGGGRGYWRGRVVVVVELMFLGVTRHWQGCRDDGIEPSQHSEVYEEAVKAVRKKIRKESENIHEI